MVSHEQAETAIMYLNNCPVLGSTISCNLSKHASIALPRPDQENAQLTKDFTNSSQHRFRGSVKHAQYLTPPTPVLHLAGLPASATEDDVKALFAQHGTVQSFKFFAKDRRMGLVQMASAAEAINALIALHFRKFHDSNIRVSFSKSTFQQH